MRAVPVLVVVCGGVVGAAARLGVTETLQAGPDGFDWALLAVNTVGSFVLGLVVFASRDGGRESLRLGLGVGFCGSFTTFSAFAVVTAELGRDGDVAAAGAFMGLSVAAAVIALTAGGVTARRIAGSRAS